MLLTNLFKPWTLIRNSMQLRSGSLTMDPPDDQTRQLESHLKLKNLGLGRAKCFVIRRCLLEMEAPSLVNKPAGVQQCKARQSRSCNAVQLCAMEWIFKQVELIATGILSGKILDAQEALCLNEQDKVHKRPGDIRLHT